MPGLGSRGLRKVRSQQLSMEGTAAEAARGSGSPSQVPPSTLQCRGSTDKEVEDRCPICLDSWREPSFVMPCLHRFCYACILRWADNKTQCPLCKGKMTSILHSLRADDDFEEHAITPPVTPPVVFPARRGHREPDAPNLHCPRAHQQAA
ncbi:E3 ubiquitin-protein ligase Topors-like isoform X2 [Anomalospiza imberbis]|uniref:E3 ubiquitin-protein ligase Topors-like isoform X2 n=1 Tax=Anomalospiza imberbis TaxID=187417 RepID=UPI00358E4090